MLNIIGLLCYKGWKGLQWKTPFSIRLNVRVYEKIQSSITYYGLNRTINNNKRNNYLIGINRFHFYIVEKFKIYQICSIYWGHFTAEGDIVWGNDWSTLEL